MYIFCGIIGDQLRRDTWITAGFLLRMSIGKWHGLNYYLDRPSWLTDCDCTLLPSCRRHELQPGQHHLFAQYAVSLFGLLSSQGLTMLTR